MARKRFIDPSFWTDIAVGKLSLGERVLFIGCFSNADDEGRLPGNPTFLRSVIFPYDDVSVEEVRSMRDGAIAACKNLALYVVGGDEFLAFRRWKKYQSPRYPQPSHLPAPPWEQGESKPAEETDNPLRQGCNQIDATLPQGCVNDEAMGSGRDQVGDQDQVRDQVRDQVGISSQDDDEPTFPPDATESERLILHELKRVDHYPLDIPKDLGHIRTIGVDFPTVGLVEEVKRWRAWLLDHPLEKKSNPRLRLRNWCEIAAKRQKERGERDGRADKSQDGPGKPGKYDDLVLK